MYSSEGHAMEQILREMRAQTTTSEGHISEVEHTAGQNLDIVNFALDLNTFLAFTNLTLDYSSQKHQVAVGA